jgi:type I restriction enzyme M protein
MLEAMPATLFRDRPSFTRALAAAAKEHGVKLTGPIMKAILQALSEQDETAEICRDGQGKPEPDTNLRDYENVPLGEDVEAYFAREVEHYVPDAWINTTARDHKDGEVGKVGYEINFNRYFYQYQPPRPLADIEVDIRRIEEEITQMLRQVTG